MTFDEQLAAWMHGTVVVMGIGNRVRGDDAAGSVVASQIAGSPGVTVIDAEDVPESFIQRIVSQRPDTVVLIDCVNMQSEPGSIALLESDHVAHYGPSTHRMPLGVLMRILERETHARVFTVGIQPARSELLETMSEPVAQTVAQLADMLNRALVAPAPAGSAGAGP